LKQVQFVRSPLHITADLFLLSSTLCLAWF